jgi:hypothetical protein
VKTLCRARTAFSLLLAASACDPVPIADVTLALRLPASRDLIEESDRIARDITVDGRDFGAELVDPSADALAFTLELSPDDEGESDEARVFSVTLLGRVGNDPIAFGAVSGVRLPTIGDQRDSGAEALAVRVPMMFGPVDAPARLNDDVTTRRAPTVCSSPEGRVWILGGTDGPAPAVADGTVFEEDALAFSASSIDLGGPWKDGDCLIDASGQPLLFGGCATDDTARNYFHVIQGGVAVELLPGQVSAGCGARLRQGPGDELWFVTADFARLRRADGSTAVSAVLDERNAPQAASTTTGDLVLARGTDGTGALVTAAVGVLAGNVSQWPIPDLDGAVLADFRTARDPIALLPDGDLKSVTRSGQQFGVRQIRNVDLSVFVGVQPEQLVVFGADDQVAVLSTADGSGDRTLLVEEPDGTLVVHSTRRDRIVKGPTRSLLLAGGDETGVDVIMLR